MSKTILVGLSLALLSTSAALAMHKHHHHRMVNPRGMSAAAPMMPGAAPPAMPGPMPATAANPDYDKYMKNLRDSGYDPKKDYIAGRMRVQ